ncbi:MAG: hypothetical protein J0H67_18635 [Rhodospirillales bacterium]|nr:hypothetical protein [Rhodospirillales bacterium]
MAARRVAAADRTSALVAWHCVAACLVAVLLAAGAAQADPPPTHGAGSARPNLLTRGSVTGWKLPRFASLEAAVVNLRRGPGKRYPIDWVYHRRGLPVEIIREFDTWRQVRMPDGTTGWVYHSLLTGVRGFLVTAPNTTLRRAPRADAAAVAHLRRGVIGQLRHCEANAAWCSVRLQRLSGWLPRTDFYGAYPHEAVPSR